MNDNHNRQIAIPFLIPNHNRPVAVVANEPIMLGSPFDLFGSKHRIVSRVGQVILLDPMANANAKFRWARIGWRRSVGEVYEGGTGIDHQCMARRSPFDALSMSRPNDPPYNAQ